MPKSESEAIRQLKENSEKNIKKADKRTTTVIMNKTNKIKEGMHDTNRGQRTLQTP